MAQIKLKAKPAMPEIIREGIIGAAGGGLIALILKAFSDKWTTISDLVDRLHAAEGNYLSGHIAWFFSVMITSSLFGLLLGLIYTALTRVLPISTARLLTWIIVVLLMAAAIILIPLGTLARIALIIIGLIATFTATQA